MCLNGHGGGRLMIGLNDLIDLLQRSVSLPLLHFFNIFTLPAAPIIPLQRNLNAVKQKGDTQSNNLQFICMEQEEYFKFPKKNS